jgi:hypothetical protein
VAGDRVLGTPSPWWTDAGRRLARHVSCSLLEIQLVATDGGHEGWAVAAVDAFPHASNPAAIQAIVALLEARLAERSDPSS